ncbi:hypothetical protein U1Q18_012889 [Sarracenia purpurea var. burkii]
MWSNSDTSSGTSLTSSLASHKAFEQVFSEEKVAYAFLSVDDQATNRGKPEANLDYEQEKQETVVLENYGGIKKESTDSGNTNQNRWVQEVLKVEGHVSPSPEIMIRVPSWRMIMNEKGEVNVTQEDAQNPCFWSRVCLHNMAKLAKEATTMRRVLESLFRCFDNGKLWPAEHGLAFPVLKDMQFLMDDSGNNVTFVTKKRFSSLMPLVCYSGIAAVLLILR